MAYKRAVAVPRAGLLVAMLVWRHTLRVSAEYCPGISVNTLVETTVTCDGSAWLGQFCCVGRAQGPGYVGCLSTLPYSDNPVLQDYGSFSNDIALLLDAIAPAIDDATSKATFCTNVGGALDSVNLPATNACLQEFSQTLEEFGCNTGSAGV